MTTQPFNNSIAKIACTHCDLLVDAVDLKKNEQATCPRCEQTLYVSNQSMHNGNAILITALLLFFPSILLPFIQLEVKGRTQIVSLIGSLLNIAEDYMILLAIVVFILVVALPLIKIVGLLFITHALSNGKVPFFGTNISKVIINLIPWGMLEVYLIGALVTIIKLLSIANISLLIGFWVFLAVIIFNSLIGVFITKKQIWQQITAIKKGVSLNLN